MEIMPLLALGVLITGLARPLLQQPVVGVVEPGADDPFSPGGHFRIHHLREEVPAAPGGKDVFSLRASSSRSSKGAGPARWSA